MGLFRSKPELLFAFRQGARAALEEVFLYYVDAVEAVIRNGCLAGPQTRAPGISEPDEARDLVHQVFARAFSPKARHAFDGLRDYRPYLLAVARNLLIDHWRKLGKEWARRVDEDRLEESDLVVEALEPEEDLDFQRSVEAAGVFVAGLSPREREFVRQRFEEEKSQTQVAQELAMSRWRVRTLEAGLRRRLRKYLKSQGLI